MKKVLFVVILFLLSSCNDRQIKIEKYEKEVDSLNKANSDLILLISCYRQEINLLKKRNEKTPIKSE
jgi:hypothetical protein